MTVSQKIGTSTASHLHCVLKANAVVTDGATGSVFESEAAATANAQDRAAAVTEGATFLVYKMVPVLRVSRPAPVVDRIHDLEVTHITVKPKPKKYTGVTKPVGGPKPVEKLLVASLPKAAQLKPLAPYKSPMKTPAKKPVANTAPKKPAVKK